MDWGVWRRRLLCIHQRTGHVGNGIDRIRRHSMVCRMWLYVWRRPYRLSNSNIKEMSIMHYKTKCNGHCTSGIDAQAETIHKLREESRKKTEALIKASKQIAQLQGEKRELTAALNKANRPMYNPRED